MTMCTEFIEAPAEEMPLRAASIDAVVSIYLFHELPPKVRGEVAKEIGRVLKPGGVFVFADSIQYGDAPDFDGLIDVFPELLHEPYYSTYAKSGFRRSVRHGRIETHAESDIAYLTKIATFEKPP